MTDPIYESTDTIHLKISDVRDAPKTPAGALRDELQTAQQTDDDQYGSQFLQLLESVYDAVLLTHIHGAIVRTNQRAGEYFQYSTEEFLDLNIIHLMAGASFEHVQTILESLREQRRLFIEADCLKRDGSRFPADITVSLLELENGHLLCFFVRNISSRKQTEAALHQAQQELVQSAHQAGMAEIATGILHDVGNLLNSVNISAEMIREAAVSETPEALALIAEHLDANRDDLVTFLQEDDMGIHIHDYLRQIAETLQAEMKQLRQETIHLRNKISTINDVVTTQQEYAKSGLFREETSLSTVIEDALAMQQGSISRHDMTIDKQLAELPLIRVPKSKLIHTLVNIIMNAKDAMLRTPPMERHLRIETGEDDGMVWCRISDTGEGIAEENLSRIFTHGFSTKETGHGFGLHTSANFMREMGGSITVDSDGIGKGASFTLSFPLNQEDDA